ncbi:calponin homology domain-containing protein DDB_G0272472-like isoform X2 [Magallana gigas]|uniref:calponin homology domain-containing protein DDB_G0272472-like isoform X2 n=1 Tax=Magallana gigas TaxID=29159 RepID=UPI00334172A7
MGCINSKVAPMPRSDRVRSKKERKILREALKKEGIVAKVSKCGVAYDILVNNDMQKPKLPPIGERAVLQIQRVQFSKMRREEAEVFKKAEVERQIEEKQQQAKRRREETEKMQKERLKRRNLKRQTNKKLGVLFNLLDILN